MPNPAAAIVLFTLLTAVPLAARAQSPLALKLDHAIRPAEGSSGMIGNASAIAVTDDGTVYVAEAGPVRVTQYDSRGAFVRVVMHDGAGPRETRNPEMAILGDTLVVYDPVLSRLTWIGPSGAELRERAGVVTNFIGGGVWVLANGTVVLEAGIRPNGNNAFRITTHGVVDTLSWERPLAADELAFEWRGPHWVFKGAPPYAPFSEPMFDPAGGLILGGTRHSRWVVMRGKDTVSTVTLADHPVTIPAAVRDSVWAAWSVPVLKHKLPDMDKVIREDRIPRTLPPWLTLHVDRAGRWWLGRPGNDGRMSAWDLVVNGKVTGRIPLPAHATYFGTGPLTAYGKDLIATENEDDDGVPWIGVYRLVRAP